MAEFSLLAVFLTGLLGGVHCVGMCGGIVGAFSLQLPGSGPRLSYHLAANLGRLTSYVIAGLIAGALGSTSAFLSQLFPAEKILYVFANLVLIALGLHLAGIWSGVLILEAAGGGVWKRLQPLFKKLVPIQSVPQAFAAGMVWGWLPCGLVYSVLIAALASGSALQGGLTMLAFGLGTLPNLLLMGIFASQLQKFFTRRGVRLTAGLVIVALGGLGLMRGFS
ncbi:MAG: sulfite exporter TauE/SafE family protein [Burkholderiales bacterium]|nr:sulfite exporter TauE/SafE family protein [Burkholderiales bacterium]